MSTSRLPLAEDSSYILTQRDELLRIESLDTESLYNYLILIDTSLNEEVSKQKRHKGSIEYVRKLNALKFNIIKYLREEETKVCKKITELVIPEDNNLIMDIFTTEVFNIKEITDFTLINKLRGQYLVLQEAARIHCMSCLTYLPLNKSATIFKEVVKIKKLHRYYESRVILLGAREMDLRDPNKNPFTSTNLILN